MKKNMKAILCTLLSAAFALPLAACGGGGNAVEGELTICYDETGYGDEWLETAARAFEQTHEGVTVKLKGDSGTGSKAVTQLKSGKNLGDLYMILDGSWREWVSRGYLASLESVYESEVETSKGKIKIKDYMLSANRDKCYTPRSTQEAPSPYIMPWGLVQVGICYNEEILLSTKHSTAKAGAWAKGDLWTEPPETTSDLLAYCTDLGKRDEPVTPFVFAGKEMHWLQFLMYGWWAQYQGVYTENTANGITEGDGTFYDFWDYASVDVWKQKGMQQAISTFQSLFCDLTKGEWKNVSPSVSSYGTQDAEREFVTGHSAMILGGSFLYNEVGDFIDLDHDGKDDITVKMMPLPIVDGAQINPDTGKPYRITYYNTDDMMFIPAKATNVELAKEFLVFLCSEENLMNFTHSNGSIRPFDYDPRADDDGHTYSKFTESVLDLYNDTEVHLIEYPVGTALGNISPLYYFGKPRMHGNMNEQTFYSNLKRIEAVQLVQDIHTTTKSVFDKWMEDLGV
mgnify:CR=1 FL=1